MAEEIVISILLKMASTIAVGSLGTLKSVGGLFRELLAAMGGVFGAGGMSAYIGAGIVFVIALLLVRFFLSESKLIISIAAIALLLFFFVAVF